MSPPMSAGTALQGSLQALALARLISMSVLGWGCSILCHPLAIRALLPTMQWGLYRPFPMLQPLHDFCLLKGSWLITPVFTNGSLVWSDSSPNYPGVSFTASSSAKVYLQISCSPPSGTFHRPLRRQSIPHWLLMACKGRELLKLRASRKQVEDNPMSIS